MLVTMESNSGSATRAPSIMDSPTLARVERARIRLEAQALSGNNENQSLERRILDPKQSSNLISRIPIKLMSSGPIKRGLLWQQRDRLFSRWKERYFVLTRDYLHCFKRASGSSNDRISDMGQFIFKIKLVDVEKVEWLNRRSYSAISLFLGREGRVLLRTENDLEDWFELLEECTLISKERRHALRITQGPRSRASLAALPSHSSLQTTHMSLGGTYSSAVEDWLLSRHKNANSTANQFQLCDSVPDLSANSSGFNENNCISMSPKRPVSSSSAPRKIPLKSYASNDGNNTTNHTNGNSSAGNNNNNINKYNNNYQMAYNQCYLTSNNFPTNDCSTPLRMQNANVGKSNGVDETNTKNSATSNVNEYENHDIEVQLRRNAMNRNMRYENASDKHNDWMYRRPTAPNDIRYSLLTDIDVSAHDSGLDTPPSTHRPSSYREPYMMRSARDSTDTGVSSLRGTLVSPKGTICVGNENGNAFRRSVQENLQHARNEKNRYLVQSFNKINSNEFYDPNQNKCYKINGDALSAQQSAISSSTNNINNMSNSHQNLERNNSNGNGNFNGLNNNNSNDNFIGLSSAMIRERYQHPALLSIMNETQRMKFRDRSYSDIQQKPRILQHQHQPQHRNNSPSPRRRPFMATPTRI